MTNRLKSALERLQNGPARSRAPGEIRTDLVEELRDAMLAEGGVGVRGVTVFMDGARVCVSFRGDDVLNWRQADACLVMENGLCDLTVAQTVDQALDLTAREIAEYLPPAVTGKSAATV